MFGAIAGGIASALAGGAMSKLFGGGQKAASGGIQGDVLATDKDRKSGSAGMPRPTSYAVFCLKKKTDGSSRPSPGPRGPRDRDVHHPGYAAQADRWGDRDAAPGRHLDYR